jgi:DNA-binding LytR/AlgR family response regulator
MNILIVEDEPKTARLLEEVLQTIDEHIQIVGFCESTEQTIQFLKKPSKKIELIFMDIQLADGLCFEIFKEIKPEIPIIFCTAYDQYTLEAFQSNGIAYILKPFNESDIEDALQKFKQLREHFLHTSGTLEKIDQTIKNPSKYKNTLLIEYHHSMIPIQIKTIAFFLLENEVLYAYSLDNKHYPIFKTLEEIESQIEPNLFFRINRQMLVNREAILEIQPYFKRKLSLKLKIDCKDKSLVSRTKVNSFLEWMEQG